MVYNFSESDEDQIMAINKGINFAMRIVKDLAENKGKTCLHDKIDVTAFLVWFVENYPESFRIMKENPDYQLNFK